MAETGDPRPRLCEAARVFYQRGWMVGTAGNLSARLPDGSFWITASGRPKGNLQSDDFLRLAPDGSVLERPRDGLKPSAESSIHLALYQLFPQSQACYHVHGVEANLVTHFTSGESLPLPPLEMIKGFNIWEENPRVEMLVLPNHADVARIAAEAQARFSEKPPRVPGFLIRDHGLTVWAPGQQEALNFVELFDYIFRYMVAARGLFAAS